MRIAPAVFALVAAGLPSCGDDADVGSYELYRHLMGSRRVEVVVSGDAPTGRLARMALELERGGEWDVDVVRDAPSDDGAARIWIADSRSEALSRLFQRDGITFDESGAVLFAGLKYSGPREALALTVPDPRRRGWPITIYVASDARIAETFVTSLVPPWQPGYRTWRDGLIEAEGTWSRSSGPTPSSASARLEELAKLPVKPSDTPEAELVAHGDVAQGALDAYAERLSAAREAVDRFFSDGVIEAEVPKPRVHAWTDLESLALATGQWSLACAGAAGEIHVVLAPGLPDDGGFAYASQRAVALAGEPSEDWLVDGVAAAAAASWHGRPLDDWTRHLLAAGLAPSTFQVADPPRRASPHVTTPLRGILAREVLDRFGSEAFVRMWSSGGAAGSLAPDWLQRRADDAREPAGFGERRERVLAAPPRRGIHLVAPRSDDERSTKVLGSRGCEQALIELRRLGFDSVALSPVSAVNGEPATWPAPRREPFESQAGDAQALATMLRARELGLEVLVTPDLLDSRSTTNVGFTMVKSRREWEQGFAELEALLVHSALVAELGNATTLCVGSGISPSTRSRYSPEDMQWTPPYVLENARRWKAILARVRRAFGGALTYSAESLGETRQLELWDDLDFVGVQIARLHVPAGGAEPEGTQLAAAFAAEVAPALEFARSIGKRALVTEVLFPPTDRGFESLETAPGSFDLLAQARLVEAFSVGLRNAARDVGAAGAPLAGAYLWCWSTDPEHGLAQDPSFAIQNRPAAESLGEFLRP